MCGIAGIFSPGKKNITVDQLKLMTDSISHRGPESDDFWINEEKSIGFGHRRLSIIDLSDHAAQPMHYLGNYIITYNGEIYNYVELRNELKKKGYHFYSCSDTEVILAAYAFFGVDCLQHFDGMFSFAIWDKQKQELFCARDRFGEKPFYYHYEGNENKLLFASEMKALWSYGIPKQINEGMLLNYLALGFTQDANDKHCTFFNNIFSLPPAHFMLTRFVGDEMLISFPQYFDVEKKATKIDYNEEQAIEEFSSLFTTSVNRRLRSDVPLGSSLSGGIDSSSVVATIHHLLNGTGKQKTFSAVFPGYEKDESTHIKQVTNQFQVENYSVTPNADDFINDIEKLCYHQEEPFQSSSIYAQYKVYELAKKNNVTVILDGQGADETIGGYTKYYHWYWQELIATGRYNVFNEERSLAIKNGQQITWGYRNYLAAFFPQLAADQLKRNAVFNIRSNKDLDPQFLHDHFKKDLVYKPAIASLNDALYYNTMQSGLQELLRYADRNSMAHSREVRLPFLNHELVQFVFSLPSSFKIKTGFTKYILRKAMEPQLPVSIVWRKDKVGFEPPQKSWMQHPAMKDYIQEGRRKLVKMGVLRKSVIDKPIIPQAAHDDGNNDWRYLCAAQMI